MAAERLCGRVVERMYMKKRLPVILVLVAVAASGLYYWISRRPSSIVLTGIVATDDVRVNSQIQGRIQKLLVQQGDTVKQGQLLALIQPQEWTADRAFYENSQKESAAQVEQAKADLKLVEAQTRDQIRQAEANLAMYNAQVAQARAELEYARLLFERAKALRARNINSEQDYEQASSNYTGSKAHVESLRKQVEAAEAALRLAKANEDQIASRKAALDASAQHLAAAGAQTEKADVLLGYTEMRAPIDGIVDVRAALQGEVVTPGQAVVTLVDPDNLWVRADVEESYIDRIHLGDKMTVRLPSGATRVGTVFFRGVDADFATQRDVSRTKRDIKTFEVRLRCDNTDRGLALGMTAYVTLRLR
jgi:HlyD family secretion protein